MQRINGGYPDISIESVYWKQCTYQSPKLFSATASVNERHELFYKTIELLHRGGGDVFNVD